jgi:hypothetical protein
MSKGKRKRKRKQAMLGRPVVGLGGGANVEC